MCFIIAIYLWIKYGGKFIIVFQPFPHIVVSSKSGIFHGTNRSGKWRIEEMDSDSFSRWLVPHTKIKP